MADKGRFSRSVFLPKTVTPVFIKVHGDFPPDTFMINLPLHDHAGTMALRSVAVILYPEMTRDDPQLSPVIPNDPSHDIPCKIGIDDISLTITLDDPALAISPQL